MTRILCPVVVGRNAEQARLDALLDRAQRGRGTTVFLYRRTSEDPEQQAWFGRLSELLAGEPQWNDGEIIFGEVAAAR